jgi:polyhydroxybutyrate depolymerase
MDPSQPPRATLVTGRRRAVAVAVLGLGALLVACLPFVGAAGGPDPARPSPACVADATRMAPDGIVVGAQERTFLVRVPDGAPGVPRDLVIAFHGRTNDAARARRYFRLDAALPEAVIVYPRALPASPGTFAWSSPGDAPEGLRDFALVDAIIEAIGAAHCIDLARVFVVGHSLGASFANDVACRRGDRIRGVASVAGGVQGGPCAGATAALVLHHPDDHLVPLSSGERVRNAFLAANGLADVPAAPAEHPALARLGCVRYDDPDHPVVWCLHDDATAPGGRNDPHTWPHGTAEAIAAFFTGLP